MFSAAFQSFEKIGEAAGFTDYCFRQTSKIKESLGENLEMFRSFSIRRDVATKAFVGRPSYQKSSIPLDSELFSSFELTKEQKLGVNNNNNSANNNCCRCDLQDTMRQSEVLSLMRENVSYKLQHGRAKEAVDMLEKLHKYATVKSVFFSYGR